MATGAAEERIAYNYYAPDLYDRRMTVLQAVRSEGKPIATLVNYAIHPEVSGQRGRHPQPGSGRAVCWIASKHKSGGMALFMNGAQGGMVTADNRLLDQPTDPDSRLLAGQPHVGGMSADRAADGGRSTADRARRTSASRTDCCTASLDVKLPVDSDVLWSVVRGSPLKYPYHPDRTVTVRINLVNIGNLQVLTIPGEALPNIGFYLKRKMRGEHAMLFGLTNDALGYILTQVDFHSFPRYDYVSRTSLGEMTGEILLRNGSH